MVGSAHPTAIHSVDPHGNDLIWRDLVLAGSWICAPLLLCREVYGKADLGRRRRLFYIAGSPPAATHGVD